MNNPQGEFTCKYNSRKNLLVSDVKISMPLTPDGSMGNINWRTYKAIWDTSAQCSVITKKVVVDLHLKSIGIMLIHGVTGIAYQRSYIITISINEGIIFPTLTGIPSCRKLPSGYDILLGMDIIQWGDFAVTNFEDKTVFSFRVPSQECIDFTL